jgi:nucleoid-associated protein YgaU
VSVRLGTRHKTEWTSGLLAIAALGLVTACGGGGAAPAATSVPPSPSGAAVAPSPARPALASPVASPSASVAGPSPTATGGAAVAGGESYEVQSGDTLATIAQQFYGDSTQWRRIYDANKDAIGSDPDKLKLGTKLTIPPKS